jgi:hypothetical protein
VGWKKEREREEGMRCSSAFLINNPQTHGRREKKPPRALVVSFQVKRKEEEKR